MDAALLNSNNSSPEDAIRNEAEINGITAYLFANAEKRSRRQNPPHGDAKSGEKIAKSIGARGATWWAGSREARARRTFGQPLGNIGNKTT